MEVMLLLVAALIMWFGPPHNPWVMFVSMCFMGHLLRYCVGDRAWRKG